MKTRISGARVCRAACRRDHGAKAQQEVKIGVLYPLSGPVAQVGIDAVAAVKTAVEIVNEGRRSAAAACQEQGTCRV